MKILVRKKGYTINKFGSMFTIFFCNNKINNYSDVQKCDLIKFAEFYCKLLSLGIYFSPSQYEANFISLRHSEKQLKEATSIIEEALNWL